MSRYIQIHALTSYPAANLNRDDLGRPKTVVMGNAERLRVSSQSLKRAWRTSEVFQESLASNIGYRTKEMGVYVYRALTFGVTLGEAVDGDKSGSLKTLSDAKAREIAKAIAEVFGKLKPQEKDKDKEEKNKDEELQIEQLAHFSPEEFEAVAELAETCRESGKKPETEDLELLRKDNTAADIALFGRMLASKTEFNVQAAAQVAHAVTVHKAVVEDDFFTAVDDLNRDDSGAGHMGVAEFGAGLFYLYVCVDRELLEENLGGDRELAGRTLEGLCRAICTVSPTGKQNSFATRANASYVLAEKGDFQPRSLSVAFLDGLNRPGNLLGEAIDQLEKTRANMDKVYGQETEVKSVNALTGEGGFDQLCAFFAE